MKKPYRILYVDDYPLDRELVRDALKYNEENFELVEAASREEFEAALAQGNFDLVLSDFNILGFEGLQVLETVHAKDPRLPVIIVTGTGSEMVAAEAIKGGAADYVIKTPAHIKRLPHTMKAVLDKRQLENQRAQVETALWESNELISLFMKHSPIYTFIKEVDFNESRVLMASDNFSDLTGIPGSKMAGKTMKELFPPEFAAKMTADDLQVVSEGKVLKLMEDFNGRHYNTIKFPISTSSKKLLAGYTIDITDNRRAEDEINRRLKDLQVLYESSLELSSQLGAAKIGEIVIKILKLHLHWERALVRLKREDGGGLETIGLSAPGLTDSNYAAEIERVDGLVGKEGQGLTGWVVQHGEGIRSGDLAADARYVEVNAGMRSGLYAPMTAGGKSIGVIGIESETENAFTELDERLLATLAKITANAIHRSRLREQTEHQLQRLGALRAIDQAIGASFDLRITLDIFLRNAAPQLGADAAMLLIVDPAMNTLEYAAEYGFYNPAIRKTHLHMGEGGAGRVAMERRMVRIPDLKQAERNFIHPELNVSENYASYHAVPLIVKGQVKGVLEVFHRNPMEPSAEWVDFLETLASQAAIAIDNNQLFESLQRSNFELAIAYDETIEGWSTALDMRDHETEGHTLRVTRLTQELAIATGMNENELVHVRRGALLHDIGKMGVPDSILLKRGELLPEEWEIMRRHPQLAYDMLAPITYLRPAIDIPYCHHEKWDGSGYPRGLKGEQIPLAARLFMVVDVWDALRSDRPYRGKWMQKKVHDHIREQTGTHFDPQAVGLFFNVLDKVEREEKREE